SADQVGRRQIFVTGDGDQRAPHPIRHGFDKARLATPRRPFEHDGKFGFISGFKKRDFVFYIQVIRFASNPVLIYRLLYRYNCGTGIWHCRLNHPAMWIQTVLELPLHLNTGDWILSVAYGASSGRTGFEAERLSG